jgi:hypothetical protein
MCFDLVSYFFLKLSKIDISENLRFRSRPGALASINDQKSPGPGGRLEHRAMDSKRQTRMKCPSLSLGGFDLSSRHYLKRSKIDISQKFEELLNR